MSHTVPIEGGGAVVAELRDAALVVTIDREPARNAVNRAVALGIGTALEFAEREREVRAVVLTGAGDRAFCAGADLRELAEGESARQDPRLERWGFAGLVRHPISKPLIAAVNGAALGGGTELVLASDLALAVPDAVFGLPEPKRGLFAAAGGVFRLPAQIPRKIAAELILTGEPIGAERALQLGLVNRVVPANALIDEALALVDTIASNAPGAVAAAKRVAFGIVDGAVEAEAAQWRQSESELAAQLASTELREGLAAFAERRAPDWGNA